MQTNTIKVQQLNYASNIKKLLADSSELGCKNAFEDGIVTTLRSNCISDAEAICEQSLDAK